MLTIDAHNPLLPQAPRRFDLLIDGAWRPAQGPDIIERASPAHEVPVTAYPAGTAADAEAAVMAARRAFEPGPWPKLKGAERSRVLLRVADLIEQRAEELALLETLEIGKPLTQARGEIRLAADLWRLRGGPGARTARRRATTSSAQACSPWSCTSLWVSSRSSRPGTSRS